MKFHTSLTISVMWTCVYKMFADKIKWISWLTSGSWQTSVDWVSWHCMSKLVTHAIGTKWNVSSGVCCAPLWSDIDTLGRFAACIWHSYFQWLHTAAGVWLSMAMTGRSMLYRCHWLGHMLYCLCFIWRWLYSLERSLRDWQQEPRIGEPVLFSTLFSGLLAPYFYSWQHCN